MRTFLCFLLLLFCAHPAQAQELPSDADGDGILNVDEDINGNGIVDSGETDPFNADTDRGGEADGSEVSAGRNPLDRRDDYTYDLDGDGLPNGQELYFGTEPSNPDTDGDGINDFDDPFPLDSDYRTDTDGDGLPDEYEAAHDLSGQDAQDADADADDDGLSNREEFVEGTNPTEADTDRDSVMDGEEVTSGENPLENACLIWAAPVTLFTDIEDHWVRDAVLKLHNIKTLPDYTRIVDGFGEGHTRPFRPDQLISRFELLKLALLSSCTRLDTDVDATAQGFADLPAIARPRESADRTLRRRVVYTALHYGIVEGYEDGTFRPDQPVSRAEALKMLFEATDIKPPEGYYINVNFADVPFDSWFFPYVDRAVQLNIVEGYGDGTFRPQQPITRAEAAKLVYLLLVTNPRINGYVVPTDDEETLPAEEESSLGTTEDLTDTKEATENEESLDTQEPEEPQAASPDSETLLRERSLLFL